MTVICIVVNEGPGVALYSANTDRHQILDICIMHLQFTFINIFISHMKRKLIFNWFDMNCIQPSCECKEVN